MYSSSASANTQIIHLRQSTINCGKILVALASITFVGSLIAAGCLFSELGYISFAIPGAGFLLTCLSCVVRGNSCSSTRSTLSASPNATTPSSTISSLTSTPSQTKTPIPSQSTNRSTFTMTYSEILHASNEEIYALIDRIPDKKWLEHRSDEYIRNFDFNRIPNQKLRQELFNIWYPVNYPHLMGMIRLHKYDLDKIYALMDLFSDDHWELSEEQVRNFDLNKLTDLNIRKKVFDIWYSKPSIYTIQSRIQSYSLDKIYTLTPLFSDNHWSFLSKNQLDKLDMGKIADPDLRKKVFHAFYPINYPYTTQARLQSYPLDKIYTLIPLFSDDHWSLLGDHIHNFDIRKIADPDLRQKVFKMWYPVDSFATSTPLRAHFRSYSLDKIYTLMSLFSDYHWTFLSDDQIRDFELSNITDPRERQRVFNLWYPTDLMPVRSRLHQYSLDKIYTLMPLFSDRHWLCLSDDQIHSFDLRRISDQELRQRVFNLWYPSRIDNPYSRAGTFQRYPLDTIYTIMDLFSDYHWQYLSEDQVNNFDTTRIFDPAVRENAVKQLIQFHVNKATKT